MMPPSVGVSRIIGPRRHLYAYGAQSLPVESVRNDGNFVPSRERVREQLERMLASRYFSQSHRLSSFLSYVVDQTLAGQEGQIKERTIGVEIFGRPADYDAASDSIVRVTAAEVRKRIAQYYQEPGHEDELRIVFIAGSYVPQFQAPVSAKEETSPIASPIDSVPVRQPPTHHRSWRSFAVSFLVAIVIVFGAMWTWRATHRGPFDFFWRPVLESSGPVLFCIADQEQYSSIKLRDANDLSRQVTLSDKQLTAVVIDDLGPIIHLAGLLQAKHKQYALRGESATTLMNLRVGPTVFVGAFDNVWTLRVTRLLRYRFTNNEQMTEAGIMDSRNPEHTWMVNNQQQMTTNNYTDYAIVARFTDSVTGEPAVVVAGVASGGTTAAAEFLTNSNDLAQLMRADKAAGNKPNMEVVLSTQIIGGEPGAPRIVASYFWN